MLDAAGAVFLRCPVGGILGRSSVHVFLVVLWLVHKWGVKYGAGMHWKGRDLRGRPKSAQIGGWRRLPKRLGAVTVGYKCH